MASPPPGDWIEEEEQEQEKLVKQQQVAGQQTEERPDPAYLEDTFECAFESTMESLEEQDGYETDSEPDSAASSGSLGPNIQQQPQTERESRGLVPHGPHIDAQMLKCLPRSNSFDFQSSSGSSSDDEDEPDDDDDVDEVHLSLSLSLIGKFGKDLYAVNPRPGYLLPPFTERRRLSQCKEEDDEDGDGEKSLQTGASDALKSEKGSKAPPRPPTPQDEASKERFKDLERLRQQFMHKIDRINTRNIEESAAPPPPPPPPPPIPATILPKALKELLHTEEAAAPLPPLKATPPPVENEKAPSSPLPLPSEPPLIINGKFKVTLAQEAAPELRVEAQQLAKLRASSNAHTISFPSSFGGYSSVQGLFSQRYGSHRFPLTATPHLSKQFFEPSLVEIRTSNVALNTAGLPNQSLHCDTQSLAIKPQPPQPPRTPSERELDDIWIRRTSTPTVGSQAHPGQRPVSLGGASTMPRLQRSESNASTSSPPRQLQGSGSVSGSVSDEEQDGSAAGSRLPGSRPSSAPAEPNAKAAKKAYKKMEKEQRRQEKEQSRREKEARKMERETARRIEREAAKLEKFNRHSEKISRSTERMAGVGAGSRSGSLERRRSGEDSPVLNQSTVHGIASPNRRPTIFDVFRPRAKSDAKRQKEKHLLDPSSADSSAGSSTYSVSGGGPAPVSGATSTAPGGAGLATGSGAAAAAAGGAGAGLMNSMKVAMQNFGHRQHPAVTITNADGTVSAKSKYKDGSAHPHQGSDAQYYHTVTAVRPNATQRSPMTKVMDLFRHRSNSAVSEADKRKARAAAHQQQLAVQIEGLCEFYKAKETEIAIRERDRSVFNKQF
ncbi:apoptotic chromatin condensation inducer in the nucleus isoform X4 [Drosophila guanche]|uniref:apoptotic chromatin condensation inducer in the nucleus isoform X4 n=1 Tax=Drosophila guanche TaxID=7266 RepID=UPI00147209A0|nr:apoptotic chromatin condensation inducer in the nucleus isoform X4 [Drosophila guanche]